MRFAVLNTENSTVWNPQNFGDMFVSKLQSEGDVWDKVMIANGEPIPNPDDYHGIVITGSHFNCRDSPNLPWFTGLCDLIRYCHKNGGPKIYGGCFGCQVIAHALGGDVGK